jgi:hypothetical protein
LNPIVEKIVAAWCSSDMSRIGSLYATDAKMVHPLVPQPLEGRAAVEQFESGMFAAFSDIDWQAKHVIDRGNELCIEFSVAATNSKPLPTPKGTVPATNKRIVVKGASVIKLNAKGEIVEEHRYFDSGSMFVQLGLA